MKRGKILIATLIFALSISAVGSAKEVYKAGTYSVVVDGHNDDVKVETTFNTDSIVKIEAKHDETKGLGDTAINQMIKSVIEKQSTDVDAVSGATVSSKALLEAVKEAQSIAKGESKELVKTFKAGTYSSTVTGHNGEMTVKVEVSNDKIKDIKVEHVESNGIGTAAIDIIVSEVVDNQSLSVDSISGATVTSNALIMGINNCIEQTGISKEVLKRPIKIAEKSEKAIQKTADVIIIGAGGSGFAAATEIVENGGTVIILEKNEYIGGNTARAGGTLNAPDPERQSKIGVEDSVELFYKNTMEAGDNKSNPELVKVFAENALAARQWLSAHGTKWTENVYQTIGGLWPRSMDEKDKVAYNGFIRPLEKIVLDKGGEIILNCKAEEILTDAKGNVTGVRAVDTKNNQVYELTAVKGVIIATGGYGANQEMVKKFNNVEGLPTSNAPTSTGDGITMAAKIGAATVGTEYVQIHPHGNPMTGGLQSHFAGVIKNSIYVNKEGKRFTEESGRRDTISEDTIKQTGQVMYSIFDSKGGFYAGVLELKNKEDLIKKKYLYEADTLEELAKKAGLDAKGLKETVARYNKLVESGKDTDFEKDELEQKIEAGPFYCVPLSPTIHHTMGGVTINSNAQVLNNNGKVIKNLYAAGEVTGGIHGTNRIGGNALTDCVVFGRIAGKRAMGIND